MGKLPNHAHWALVIVGVCILVSNLCLLAAMLITGGTLD